MMTMDELFAIITKLTDGDKRKAIQAFLGFDDFLIDALPGYCEEKFEFDFGSYVAEIIGELEAK